jgi:acetoacetate decarboxylase
VEKDCRKISKDLLPNIFEHVENLTNNPLPQFNADIEKAETVVAHNLDFDLPIVTTEFLRCRLESGLGENNISAP